MIKPSPSIEYLQYPHIYIPKNISIGKRLVILAEAEDGPLYEPLLIYHADMAADFFKGGDLVRLYQDVSVFNGNIPVYLMRIETNEYEIAFSVLEAFSFDLIYFNEMYFNKSKDLIDKFLLLCRTKEEQGCLIHGITTLYGSMSAHDLLLLSKDIQDLTVDFGNEAEETGKYLSLVTNQMELYDSGAVYAGMLASLNPEVSPINKTIPSVKLTNEYSNDEIKLLRSIGIVCFRNTFKNGVTCTSSSCAVSTSGSVHKHISNFRIAQYLINQISLELRPFIGSSNPTLQAMDINNVIEAICVEQISLNRIRDYGYQLRANDFYGYIEVEVEVVPIFSVQSITTHSRVQVFK